MIKKLNKIALIGKTNSGKSTLINSIIGEKITISNRKINTTIEIIIGIKNIKNTQLIFYDTPGSNFLKTNNLSQKKFKIALWEAIEQVDVLIYLVDATKYNYENIKSDISKLCEVKKIVLVAFNKIDLIKNHRILSYIDELKDIKEIKKFFIISGKFNDGINEVIDFLILKSYHSDWLYNNNEITDKDDKYIANECTRNAMLYFLNKEIPYNLNITNKIFKYLKNNDLKIKQIIQISNTRHKSIILGKNGSTIKRIREKSQKDIKKIFNTKIHLYLQIILENDK